MPIPFAAREALTTGVKALYRRASSASEFGLTYQEAREIFLDPGHTEILAQAQALFGNIAGRNDFIVTHAGIRARLQHSVGNKPGFFPFPTYMGKRVFQPEHPALEALHSFMELQQRLADEFAMAYVALRILGGQCKSVRQLAFIFPPIVHVLEAAADMMDRPAETIRYIKELAQQLTNVKMPGFLPPMNLGFKDALATAAGAITRTTWVPKDFEPTRSSPIHVTVQWSDHQFDVDWKVGGHEIEGVHTSTLL